MSDWRAPQMGPDDSTDEATCPGCGRTRPVWELVDLRGAKPSLARADRVPDYACGACRGRMERGGVMSRLEMVRAMGAPQVVVDRMEASVRRRGGPRP